MTVERGSDKHGPGSDDELAYETEGMTRAARGTHAEEWAEPEPSAEDQPASSLDPAGPDVGGTPPGMDADDVQGRSELGQALRRGAFPTDRGSPIVEAGPAHAPPAAIDQVPPPPHDPRPYPHVQAGPGGAGHTRQGPPTPGQPARRQ